MMHHSPTRWARVSGRPDGVMDLVATAVRSSRSRFPGHKPAAPASTAHVPDGCRPERNRTIRTHGAFRAARGRPRPREGHFGRRARRPLSARHRVFVEEKRYFATREDARLFDRFDTYPLCVNLIVLRLGRERESVRAARDRVRDREPVRPWPRQGPPRWTAMVDSWMTVPWSAGGNACLLTLTPKSWATQGARCARRSGGAHDRDVDPIAGRRSHRRWLISLGRVPRHTSG
jgi:hypothetical protein